MIVFALPSCHGAFSFVAFALCFASPPPSFNHILFDTHCIITQPSANSSSFDPFFVPFFALLIRSIIPASARGGSVREFHSYSHLPVISLQFSISIGRYMLYTYVSSPSTTPSFLLSLFTAPCSSNRTLPLSMLSQTHLPPLLSSSFSFGH